MVDARNNKGKIARRTFLRKGGAAAIGVAALSAGFAAPAFAAPKTIKIGYVTPRTGPLAAFAEADKFVIGQMKTFLKGGLQFRIRDRLNAPPNS